MPDKPELKIREYELFKAFYCGVCKSIGRRFGILARMTLTYDSAFLSLLLFSLNEGSMKIRRERCIVHPVKKRPVVTENKIIDYSSDINIILAYYNLEDNWKDERSKLSGAGMLALKSAYKKLRNKYREKCEVIEKRLHELHKLEKGKCSSMDMAAEPFARLMEDILDYDEFRNDEKLRKLLKWIGYNMGKWIYILDAYDDLEDDIREKSYNPLIHQFDYKNQDISAFKEEIREKVEFNLTYALSEISKAYELLKVHENKGLIENIIYMGMLRKTEQILNAGSCKKSEESV